MISIRLEVEDVVLKRRYLHRHIKFVITRLLISIEKFRDDFSVEVVDDGGDAGWGSQLVGEFSKMVFEGRHLEKDGDISRIFKNVPASSHSKTSGCIWKKN